MACNDCKKSKKEKQIVDLIQKIQELTTKVNTLETELSVYKAKKQKDNVDLTFFD